MGGLASGMAALAAARSGFAEALETSGGGGSDYTLAPGLAYLNHASIGTVPKVVQRAHREYLALCETHPSLYTWGEPWDEHREAVRADLAFWLGCTAGELAITHNTTEGFNLLASGLPLAKGDEVLFPDLNHSGASLCFEHFGPARGYRVRTFDVPAELVTEGSDADVVDLYARAIRPDTRLLVLPHIDNRVGLRHPLPEITAKARERGVEWLAVDGAQSIGMIPVNLAETGVDFYSTSPHKWLQSPKGLGLFYLRKERIEELRPMWVTWGQSRWQGSARIFEDYGTRDLPEVLALGDALAYHRRVDWRERQTALERLRNHARGLAAERGIGWASPEGWRQGASLFTLDLPGADPIRLETLLTRANVAARVFTTDGGAALRLSPNVANRTSAIDRAFALL